MQHFSRKALPLFPHSPATLLLNSPADPANPIPMNPHPLPPAGDIASPAAEDGLPVEAHPLPPFLPEGARILFLGSFPPPRKRWCMDFFYPNWTNDFWRIWGFLAAGDKDYFTVPGQKRFDRARIEQFCRRTGCTLGAVLKIGSGEAILDTPFVFLVHRRIRVLAAAVTAGRPRVLQVTMPIPKRLFVAASAVYWENYGRRSGISKQQMQSMDIEPQPPVT